MIQKDEEENIKRLYFIKRHGIRQIARDHHSRKTARKAISDACISQYYLAVLKPCLAMAPYLLIMGNWLREDMKRPVKQCHTAHRIYERLVSEYSFRGSERKVREHVSKL